MADVRQEIWSVSDKGFIFPKTAEETPDQLVKMRENQLDVLWAEGLACLEENQYVIPHDKVVLLDSETKEFLELPDELPFEIEVNTKSNVGAQDFRYHFRLLDIDGRPFFNPTICGAYVRLNDCDEDSQYLLNFDQYQLLQCICNCNRKIEELANSDSSSRSSSVEANVTGYAYTAKIQHYAELVRIKLEQRIREKKIVLPDKLSIRVKENDDNSYSVLPVLLKKHKENYSPIVDAGFDESFAKKKYSDRRFQTKDGTIYVFTQEQGKCLNTIRKYKSLSKEQAERIKIQPREVFDSEEFFFDLNFYGDRVINIGAFKENVLPFIKPEANDWLPAEGTSVMKKDSDVSDELPTLTPENIGAVKQAVLEAQSEGKQSVVIDGTEYPLTQDLLELLNHKEEEFRGDWELEFAKPEEEQTAVLNIRQNIDELLFRAKEREKHYAIKNTEELFTGLKPGTTLYQHQKEGIAKMAACWTEGHKGVLLADDMGLGKTPQAYGFISALKKHKEGPMPSVLIVAPVALLKNWEEEYAKFVADGIFKGTVALYGSSLRDRKFKDEKGNIVSYSPGQGLKSVPMIDFSSLENDYIVLTSYETLRDYQLSFGRISWSVLILDEAQKIKNPSARISVAAKAMKYDFGISLTGTPVENTWIDLWSIMDFVEPGKLKTLREFNDNYQKKLNSAGRNVEEIKALGEQLRDDLNPLFIRRLKSDIAKNLPTKTIKKYEDPMTEPQRNAYNELIAEVHKSQDHNKGYMLRLIASLRDVSLCPDLAVYNDKYFGSADAMTVLNTSARLIRTKKILDEIRERQEKVIIFVESRKLQGMLVTYFERIYNIYVPTPINGTMQAFKRQEIVDKFNHAKGFGILILSPLAAGVGLNITGANNVIHLSRCWNPAKEDQATDRVYRIGQTLEVTVYIPMAVDPDYPKESSFDIILDQLLDYKRKLGESALFPTGDSPENGYDMFQTIFGTTGGEEGTVHGQYWTIVDIDKVTGKTFEHIVTSLYDGMDCYSAEKTRDSNDRGADIVVRSTKNSNLPNLLIQCKQTSTKRSMNADGVREVIASKKYYEKINHCQFKCVVVTNAYNFTHGARELAKTNRVQLIAREALAALLTQFPVERRAAALFDVESQDVEAADFA